MRTLTAGDLLRVWEHGTGLHTIDRSLQLLALAFPDRTWGDLARLSLGSRDALLLAVRRASLGDRVAAQDVCPGCGSRVEIELLCSRLASAGETPPAEWSIDIDGYRLTLRPLDSVATAAAAQCKDVASARSLLLARSVVTAEHGGEPVAIEHLPFHVSIAVADSIGARDAAAELMLHFRCPECSHDWHNVLDVASFVWTEIAARAQRLLIDVHTLARAYGWREADILEMSAARRAAYLALVAA